MFITYFIILIIVNLILYLGNDSIAKYFQIYDRPDKVRKLHKKPVPII